MKENQRCCEECSLKDYFQRAEGNLMGKVNIIYIKRMLLERVTFESQLKNKAKIWS